jgi:hypothetical protein
MSWPSTVTAKTDCSCGVFVMMSLFRSSDPRAGANLPYGELLHLTLDALERAGFAGVVPVWKENLELKTSTLLGRP